MAQRAQLTIGILAMSMASDYHAQIAGMTKNYMKLACQSGGENARVRMISPDQGPEEMKVDLLILPGGPDLSLALRPENNSNAWIGQGKDQPYYTHFYCHGLQKWIDARVPMFGICLGSQGLAAHFGAKLITDMHGHQIDKTHSILRLVDEQIGFGSNIIETNSRHHQAISPDNFPTELEVIAYGGQHESEFYILKNEKRRDAIKRINNELVKGHFVPSHVEAFRHTELPIAAVQWHPEDMLYGIDTHGDLTSREIISWLLSHPNAHQQAEVETQVQVDVVEQTYREAEAVSA